MTDYPALICMHCGNRYGSPLHNYATWHAGVCGWCNKPANVTEPRDFRYPLFPPHKDKA